MDREMKRLKKNRKLIYIVCCCIIFFWITVIAIVYVYPIIFEKQCKQRVYSDLQEKIDDTICSANIRIVIKLTQSGENDSSYHYGEIGCGVIFRYEDGYYYALTAAHVVDGKSSLNLSNQLDEVEKEDRSYYIVPYGTLTYEEQKNKVKEETNKHLFSQEYYEQFEQAEVEYISESCDIAIIRFKSDEDFECLKIAENDVEYDDRIISFGSSETTGSDVTYGIITSEEYKTFDAHDGRNPDQVLFNNAYVEAGASGGAILNENLEIAGVTIGGRVDFLGRFEYGVMVPAGIIGSVIQDWKLR